MFDSQTFGPMSWMCKKQTALSHNSAESGGPFNPGDKWHRALHDVAAYHVPVMDAFRRLDRPIAEQVIEVSKISCRGSAEVAKNIPQERISERMGKQSKIIEMPKISCQESVGVVKSYPSGAKFRAEV